MAIEITQIEMALSHVDDPDLGKSLTSLGMIENIQVEGQKVTFDLVLTTPACPMKNKMKEECIQAIHEYVDPNVEVVINATSRQAPQPSKEDALPGVKNVILVASGKGGVGKSTVAVNLAISLANNGAKVGLVDADIHGPSIPIMFNIKQQEIYGEEHNGKTYMLPLKKYGVKLMSLGLMVKSETPLAYRGPMASNILKQLVLETWWDEIDYLVVDMPPGTGDIQLTIANALPVTGAVIVSTPQRVALADVVRGVEMFRTQGMDIPVLGFVENMSYFTPAELPDHKYFIFGKNGCRDLAESMNIPLLGEIPLVQSIAEGGDCGQPISLDFGDEPTPEAKAFNNVALNLIKEVCKLNDSKK